MCGESLEIKLAELSMSKGAPKSAEKLLAKFKENRVQILDESRSKHAINPNFKQNPKEYFHRNNPNAIAIFRDNVNIINDAKDVEIAYTLAKNIGEFLEHNFDSLSRADKETASNSLNSFIGVSERYFGDIGLLKALYYIESEHFATESERSKIARKVAAYDSLHERLANGEWDIEDKALLPPMKCIKNNFFSKSGKSMGQIAKAHKIQRDYLLEFLYVLHEISYSYVPLKGVVEKSEMQEHLERNAHILGADLKAYIVNFYFKDKKYVARIR